MNDWAEDAALKSAEQDKIRAGNIAKQNRESAVRAEIGPKLFKELSIWISNQVAKFNELRGKPELKVDVTKADSPHPEMFFDGFIVSRLDKSKQSLRVNYSALTGVLSYEYGGGKGNFTLKASEDGTMQFQTTYSEVKTIEEIGTELLSKFSESTL